MLYMLTSMLNVSLEPVMSTPTCTPAFEPSHAAAAWPSPPFTPWLANALANVLSHTAERLRTRSQPVAPVALANIAKTPDAGDWMALEALSPQALKDIGAPAWLLAQVNARRDAGLDVAALR